MREIIFYKTHFGDRPVEDFLIGLDAGPRAKIIRNLEMLRTMPFVPSKFWKKMRGAAKIWEMPRNMRAILIGFLRPQRKTTA